MNRSDLEGKWLWIFFLHDFQSHSHRYCLEICERILWNPQKTENDCWPPYCFGSIIFLFFPNKIFRGSICKCHKRSFCCMNISKWETSLQFSKHDQTPCMLCCEANQSIDFQGKFCMQNANKPCFLGNARNWFYPCFLGFFHDVGIFVTMYFNILFCEKKRRERKTVKALILVKITAKPEIFPSCSWSKSYVRFPAKRQRSICKIEICHKDVFGATIPGIVSSCVWVSFHKERTSKMPNATSKSRWFSTILMPCVPVQFSSQHALKIFPSGT